MILFDLTNHDSGKYTCVSVNDAGRDQFSSVLTVESPPKIKLGAGRVNADINDAVTLECETEGSPPPEVTWFKGGTPLAATLLDQFLTRTGSLKLPSVTMDDVGL